jgi:hypothetical protein
LLTPTEERQSVIVLDKAGSKLLEFAGHYHILAIGRWSRRHPIKGRTIPDVRPSLPGKRPVTNNLLENRAQAWHIMSRTAQSAANPGACVLSPNDF